ncbi:MAG: mismatch-specific DNA-glycosylase [Chloroflexota bacterium]|nr:mismatch-specific DNA-glycosylase [Chloroflexota bacterium]
MTNGSTGSGEMITLPDQLREGLDLLFVGLNPSQYSAEVGHYFANPRNRFWPAFNLSKLVARQVTAEEDATLLDDGIGFTDVAKRPTPMGSGLRAADFRQWAPVLKEKIFRFAPRLVCFHGLMAYKAYLQHGEGVKEKPELGLQERMIGNSAIFVVPNPSPANAKYSLNDLADWYGRLGEASQR